MPKLENLLFAAILSAGGGACAGSDSAEGPPFVEGSRLKAVYQQVDGAPPLFLNWYDTVLGVDCLFKDVGLPDRVACFPTEPVGVEFQHLFSFDTGSYFADSACTVPLVPISPGPCAARFVSTEPGVGDACGTTVRLFPFGPAVARDPGAIFIADPAADGACAPAPDWMLGALEFHPLGPEIPMATLVTGTSRHGAGPERITPITIVGSDGSRQIDNTNAWDTERGESVSASLPGETRWFPSSQYQLGVFADGACTIPAALGSSCARAAHEAFGGQQDACGNLTAVTGFELGAPLADQTSVFFQDPTGCYLDDAGAIAPSVNPKLAAFSIGAPVPVTAFAERADVRTGSGRIRVIQASGEGERGTYGTGFFDDVLQQPCSFSGDVRAADGSIRCLPPAPEATVFADDRCTVPLLYLTPDTCGPMPAFFSTVDREDTQRDTCSPAIGRHHIYPVSDPYVGSLFDVVLRNGIFSCEPSGTATGNSGYRAFSAGPEIPADAFAAAVYVRPS